MRPTRWMKAAMFAMAFMLPASALASDCACLSSNPFAGKFMKGWAGEGKAYSTERAKICTYAAPKENRFAQTFRKGAAGTSGAYEQGRTEVTSCAVACCKWDRSL